MLTPERPFLLGVNFLPRRKAIMNSKTKRVTTIGMLCAITYVTMVVGRIPIILFLKYDPSDVIVTLGGFIWGPMTSCTSKSLKNFHEFPELLAVPCTGQNLAVINKNSQLCTNGQNQLFPELLHRAVQ